MLSGIYEDEYLHLKKVCLIFMWNLVRKSPTVSNNLVCKWFKMHLSTCNCKILLILAYPVSKAFIVTWLATLTRWQVESSWWDALQSRPCCEQQRIWSGVTRHWSYLEPQGGGAVPQALNLLGEVRFIAWRLKRPF